MKVLDMALDEGDMYWCWPCVRKWEAKHNEDFFTGNRLPAGTHQNEIIVDDKRLSWECNLQP